MPGTSVCSSPKLMIIWASHWVHCWDRQNLKLSGPTLKTSNHLVEHKVELISAESASERRVRIHNNFKSKKKNNSSTIPQSNENDLRLIVRSIMPDFPRTAIHLIQKGTTCRPANWTWCWRRQEQESCPNKQEKISRFFLAQENGFFEIQTERNEFCSSPTS